MGQVEQAIRDYGEAIQIDPEYALAYTNRALAYTLAGQDEKAQQDVNRAVELGSDRGALDSAIEELREQQ